MSEQTHVQLERLLQQMEPREVPDDAAHRYALRRALLNSSRFERNRVRVVWTRLFMYTTSLVAGGAVMAVFVVSVMTVELGEQGPVAASGFGPQVTTIELAEDIDRTPRAEFASFAERPEVRQVLEFAKPQREFAISR